MAHRASSYACIADPIPETLGISKLYKLTPNSEFTPFYGGEEFGCREDYYNLHSSRLFYLLRRRLWRTGRLF
jgi:hypothetical protein